MLSDKTVTTGNKQMHIPCLKLAEKLSQDLPPLSVPMKEATQPPQLDIKFSSSLECHTLDMLSFATAKHRHI